MQSTAITRGERPGPSPGLVRALFTLAGVVAAGLLVWTAQSLDLDSGGGFWAAMGVLAVAGFALGLSQLLGGWTKWGRPAFSWFVFLAAFLPTLVIATWILLAEQPDSGWQQGRFAGWTGDLGLEAFVNDVGTFVSVVPVVVGLVLAFSFDTTGPRAQIIERHYPSETQESVVEELRRKREEAPVEEAAEPVAVGETSVDPVDDERRSLSQGT
jgi:hypothetical protein